MIKPVKKVHVEEDWLSPDRYNIETKDKAVFKFLEEFGTVSPGSDRRFFRPSKLYDPDDIKDMLGDLDKTPPNLIAKATAMVKGLKKYDGHTIETMRIGQRAYTLPWAFVDPLTLKWCYEVTSRKMGTSDMPITRISLDTWEIEPARSSFWEVLRVRKVK